MPEKFNFAKTDEQKNSVNQKPEINKIETQIKTTNNLDALKIKPIESLDMNKLRRAIHNWGLGNLEEALELYEEYGIKAFRKLNEKYWKLKNDFIILFRAIKKDELEKGPIMFAGKDDKKRIQRLTSWTADQKFAEQWAGQEGIIISIKAGQEDIAFFPLNSPFKFKEKEVVIADYHLKPDKLIK